MVIIPYFFSIDNSHRNDTLNLILFSNFHLVKQIFAIEAGNLLDLLKNVLYALKAAGHFAVFRALRLDSADFACYTVAVIFCN